MGVDKKALVRSITLWNETRLDLFEITFPDKNFEFHGVIRFYHQDSSNEGKYATKCVRVSNSATTLDVIETLAEKFRSDMRMLTKPSYALYEVHVNGESRRLKDDEFPLTVQLKWLKDDREGRFLLRNEDDLRPVHVGNGLYEESEDTIKGFKLTRNLTKKEKKQKKKKDKLAQKGKEENQPSQIMTQEESAAKQLYSEVPESTFTRTVSNPESVMKKRREQKLQKRGAELLKIYGDSINKEIPYKTLLLLPSDDTNTVIRDTLDKYGLGKAKTIDYMLVQVVLPPGSNPEDCLEGGWGKETILGDEHFPLDMAQKWQPHQGTLVFQLRPSTAAYVSRKKQKSSSLPRDQERNHRYEKERRLKRKDEVVNENAERGSKYENVSVKRPKLLEVITPDKVVTHSVAPNVTEIGSDRRNASYGPFIELRQVPGLLTSHCVITNMDGVVTVTPHDGNGEVFVDGKAIEETTMLKHGNVVWLGRGKNLVFCDPGKDISMGELQHRIRSTVPREQPTRRSQTNMNNGMRQRDGSSSNVSSVDRSRQHSVASSASSRSGSANQVRAPLHEQRTMQNVMQQRHNQEKERAFYQPPLSNSPSDKGQQRMPPQTATVQPFHQSNPHRLPASLRVSQGVEESLVVEILSVQANTLHFKLSPAYSIYLMQRYFVEANRSMILPNQLLVVDLLERTMELNSSSVSELSFWMANSSEFLNFIRQDQDLSPSTTEIQESLAKTVQAAFRHLVQCMQRTLYELMPAFLSQSDDDLPGGNNVVDLKKQNRNTIGPTMYDILHMLSSAMSLLRRCRVNAALTIQLFSQLFHSVNMWLFNKLVDAREGPKLCCREWGMRIRARLALVETWAEKQGLELAADCHLARITQATHLLQAPKHTGDDIAAISGTCFKLNSLQLRVLLTNYQPADGENRISRQLIQQVVAAAENSADELTRSDGRDVQLEEDPDLQLPFLLPEDGYSCDVVKGVPSGLTEFLQVFERAGLCNYKIEANTAGTWTVHFHTILQQYQNVIRSSRGDEEKDERMTISFNKQGGGMGLSIVAARGLGLDKLGVYIRSVVKGGAADMDGRLQSGDQLLSVDGRSLVGLDQASAADLMKRTGSTVMLEIAKQAAIHHGLAKLLSQPSPKLQHVPPAQRRLNPQLAQARPKSEGYALPPQKPASTRPSAQAQLFGTKPHVATANPALNASTPQLNESQASHVTQPLSASQPRSAVSMGNLQRTPRDTETDSSRNLRNQYSSYSRHQPSNMERKTTSQTALATSTEYERRTESHRNPQSIFEQRTKSSSQSVFSSPRDVLPSPPVSSDTPRSTEKYPQNSLDNPNYDHFPSPPPDLLQGSDPNRQFKPLKVDSPPVVSPGPVHAVSPRIQDPAEHRLRHSSQSPNSVPPSQSSKVKTLDRPSSGKKTEVARITPSQKKRSEPSPSSNKSATLPRHFKSVSPWERDEREKKEQSIQEQLNALRDEEIEELSARNDLSPLEQDRLKNLLQEKEFQNRVHEERMKMFSDEDQSEEDYSVPDRPDRDRLIQIEGAHALRDAAAKLVNEKEDEDHKRWKEEQQRKKEEAELRAKQEAERRDERRREREKAERERQEERRRRELQQQEEQRRYEEEQIRIREKEEEWRTNYNNLQREEEEQRRRLEEIRRMREEEEKQLKELQKQREADVREEAEREMLEQKLSAGKPSNFSPTYKKYAPVAPFSSRSNTYQSSEPTEKPHYKRGPSSVSSIGSYASTYDSRAIMRENPRSGVARPVSDGYALGKTDWMNDDMPPPPSEAPSTPPSTYSSRRPVSFVSSNKTPNVIGSQEVYNDPRNRREATLKRDQSLKRRGPEPSRMTFRDRQRLFQGGTSSPISKPKSSRKLLELEQSLRGQV